MVAAVGVVIAVGIVGVAEPALLGAVSAPLLPVFFLHHLQRFFFFSTGESRAGSQDA